MIQDMDDPALLLLNVYDGTALDAAAIGWLAAALGVKDAPVEDESWLALVVEAFENPCIDAEQEGLGIKKLFCFHELMLARREKRVK